MSIKQLNPRMSVLLLFMLAAGILRIILVKASAGNISPVANFTPIGAMGLFGGAYFSQKWKSYVFPLLTLFLSDIVINSMIYHLPLSSVITYEGWYFTYLAFAAMVLVGQFMKHITVTSVLAGAVAAACIHWIISDIGPFLFGTDITTGLPFEKSFAGFQRCLYLAIPFELKLLWGNLIYGAIFFGSFELMQRRFPVLAKQAL